MIKILAKLPIFKRLIPSIGTKVLRLLKKNRGFFKIGKINFYLDFLYPIDRQIIIHEKYEDDPDMTLAMVQYLTSTPHTKHTKRTNTHTKHTHTHTLSTHTH